MLKMIKDIYKSMKEVLSHKRYLAYFIAISIIFFIIYFSVPLYTVPGNTLEFYLSITPFYVLALIVVLSLLVGLIFSMNIYSFSRMRKLGLIGGASGIVGAFSGFFSTLFSSATCAACLSVIFAFLGIGTGTILLLLNYRWQITLAGIALSFVSLYLVSNSIQKNFCEVDVKDVKRKKRGKPL